MKIVNRIAFLVERGYVDQARCLCEKTIGIPVRSLTRHKERSLRAETTYNSEPAYLEIEPCLINGHFVKLQSPSDFGVFDDDAREFEDDLARLLGRDWLDIDGMRGLLAAAEGAVRRYREQLNEMLDGESKGT